MNSVLRELNRWRLRERMIRLAWGFGRWFAVVATVLAFACLADWLIDRYAGSQTWRDLRKSSWVFAPADPLSVGETPFWWFRVPLTLAQLALAGVLAYYLLVRAWVRTPPVDDFAAHAEKAFPAFDHRLVTAIQLNRPTADTRGMSRMLIGEVTREAGEIAAKHDLLKLVDYRRLARAAAVAAPVALVWAAFFAANPALATILVKRQALLDAEIPRSIHLENVTPDVWPTGSEVTVRFRVAGRYRDDMVGVLRLVPEGQPEEFYELRHEALVGTDTAYFAVKLPPMSRDFKFQARLGQGRTREPGEVRFEYPPQLAETDGLAARQILPTYLGAEADGSPFVRRDMEGAWKRGEVTDALPRSRVLIEAKFNKPVKTARLVPIERAVVGRLFGVRFEVAEVRFLGVALRKPNGERIYRVRKWRGSYESELNRLEPLPEEPGHDRRSAAWGFPTTPRMIGYRIELEDDRGFRNPVPIRRNVRMWEDRPPLVAFKPESTRNPDPASGDWDKGVSPRDFEWDMPLGPSGRVQVIYTARSEVGIRAANVVYRVIPRGVDFAAYPESYRAVQHPRDDVNGLVYNRLPLRPFAGDPEKLKLGRFVPELGKFEQSGKFGEVELYLVPAARSDEPGALDAAGCKLFETSGLVKRLPDGSTARVEVGDTVELYLEVFDRLTGPDGKPDPNRPAGYTSEARSKIVLSEADANLAFRQRDEARQRLRDKLLGIAEDQARVFKEKEEKK
jgi:hypothetical protein